MLGFCPRATHLFVFSSALGQQGYEFYSRAARIVFEFSGRHLGQQIGPYARAKRARLFAKRFRKQFGLGGASGALRDLGQQGPWIRD